MISWKAPLRKWTSLIILDVCFSALYLVHSGFAAIEHEQTFEPNLKVHAEYGDDKARLKLIHIPKTGGTSIFFSFKEHGFIVDEKYFNWKVESEKLIKLYEEILKS